MTKPFGLPVLPGCHSLVRFHMITKKKLEKIRMNMDCAMVEPYDIYTYQKKKRKASDIE